MIFSNIPCNPSNLIRKCMIVNIYDITEESHFKTALKRADKTGKMPPAHGNRQ
jgi:hypothetical protein